MKRAQWTDEDRRRRRADAATRRQRIVLHLERGDVLSGQELACRENVSLRTIWRDIDTLRHQHGHNIVSSHGTGGGYILRPKVRWPFLAESRHGGA